MVGYSRAPQPPKKCMECINFNKEDMICKFFEELPGEGSRKDITDCPSYYNRNDTDDLRLLAEYVQEDPDGAVEARINDAVSRILNGYETRFQVMVVGIARRKIKSMVRMVDVIDILLNKLSDVDETTINDMTPSQLIRLLSELNNSVNNDLSFIMKLLQPDSDLKSLQAYIDNRSININGASPETEIKAEEILKLTGTSRDKIRGAFDAILNSIEVPGVEEPHEMTEDDQEDLELI